MKNMKQIKHELLKGLAKVFISIGAIGAINYSTPMHWYEPRVPESLLKEEDEYLK